MARGSIDRCSWMDNLRLTGGVLQVLGGQTDGALDVQVAVLGAGDEVTADCNVSDWRSSGCFTGQPFRGQLWMRP
jgi:hypothetical protein